MAVLGWPGTSIKTNAHMGSYLNWRYFNEEQFESARIHFPLNILTARKDWQMVP
jgi:hypothetical protein